LTLGPAVTLAAAKDIYNYVEYSDAFSSGGMPTKKQLEDASKEGFGRIVYIAFSDHEDSLPDEDRLVKSLGMQYLQIPVDWDAPRPEDFYLLAGAMQRAPDTRTLLHCQANFRASAFSFLYRVVNLGVPVATAKADMNKVWTPNETWTKFLLTILEENDIPADCEGCDWTPARH
jgi:protein tyrosine phosphatase (PTP) superfamily phosphohydrolase (DUF442 family)